MSNIDEVLDFVDKDLNSALDRLFDFIRFKSISTDPQYKPTCKDTALWMVEHLNELGFDASIRETTGHPMVVAHHDGDGPHLLFYGHYDVQPVDPIELWNTDPFKPTIQETKDGPVIRGRGTSDDKGQIMTFIEAFRAWKKIHGKLPARLTLFFEGEEESGSPSLVPFMEENKQELTADIAMICDTGLFNRDTAAIITMLRGLLGVELTITAANKDLHSGFFGGAAMNPARVLVDILAGLHDQTGRITLDEFYNDVPELSDVMKAQWNSLDFDKDRFLSDVGLSVLAGEKDRTALEQIWARPTCEINGMESGYTGAGFKTVLPAEATAKVSFRLVGNQDPDKIRQSFFDYVASKLPDDCSVNYIDHSGSKAVHMSTENPMFAQAKQALNDEWPNGATYTGAGGSIPVAGHFKDILGMDAMLIGFGLNSDAIHSPNEKYDMRSFRKGIRSWVRILDQLSNN